MRITLRTKYCIPSNVFLASRNVRRKTIPKILRNQCYQLRNIFPYVFSAWHYLSARLLRPLDAQRWTDSSDMVVQLAEADLPHRLHVAVLAAHDRHNFLHRVCSNQKSYSQLARSSQ